MKTIVALIPGPTDAAGVPAERLDYQAPQLVRVGDVRDLTLGGSPGIGDSGNAGLQRF
jgi:hypothetical protein